MKTYIILLALVLFNINNLCSQMNISAYEERDGFGLFGNLNYNSHDADFRSIPGVPTCCPNFINGEGYGFSAGVMYQMPLTNYLFLTFRGGYFNRNGVLTTDERSPRTTVNLNGNPVQGVFRHKIDAYISSIGIEPLAGLRLWKNLSLLAGFQTGFVINRKYDITESIAEPEGGTFENDSRTRLSSSGELNGAMDYDISALIGLSYDFPLSFNNTWFLQPEVFYSYSLLPVIDHPEFQKNWSINSIRAGLALKYFPANKEPVFVSSSIETPKHELYADVNAYGLYQDGSEKPVVQVRVEEFLSTKLAPLLTYVFFDEESDEIPDRYNKLTREQANRFTIEQLRNAGTLEAYHHLLNIIGYRLRQYPEATIVLDGCNSDQGGEKNNLDLSLRRADNVKDYLVSTWSIDPGRIKTTERNLPQDPSNPNEAYGIEENRRVEISSSTFDIVAPLIFDDTLRSVNPPVVRFRNTYSGTEKVDTWTLGALCDDSPVCKFDGEEEVPPVLDWTFTMNERTIPRNERIDYQFVVNDKAGQSFTSPLKNLPVEQVTVQKKRQNKVADKYVDRYSLILFQFDKSHLGVINQKIMDIVKSRIQPTSTISVYGHTDLSGTAEHNKKLSEDRAQTVSDLFNKKDAKSYGIGESEIMFDNNLPEGRFYCRRVDIIVETPIEE